jgi:hypothetical protein
MPCMNSTSARVCLIVSAAARASTLFVGSPGAPGWTTLTG